MGRRKDVLVLDATRERLIASAVRDQGAVVYLCFLPARPRVNNWLLSVADGARIEVASLKPMRAIISRKIETKVNAAVNRGRSRRR